MNLSHWIPSSLLVAALAALAAPAVAQQPLSVIDWLDEDLAVVRPTPERSPEATVPGALDEPPVAESALSPDVAVMPLDAPNLAAVGLLPPSRTGLPATLWRGSDADTLIKLIGGLDASGSPAMTALLFTLLVAEADPPAASGNGSAFLAARARTLMNMGAVEAAEALLNQVSADEPDLFGVWLDVALLTGQEDAACAALRNKPGLTTDLASRIFCAARGQDWQTAMTVLDSAVALGTLQGRQAEVLRLFLDPELAEMTAPTAPPVRPTPLEFRLYEAIGERASTRTLPLPFATIDLGGDAGWRAQIEAAERLAKAGAISDNQLLGIYTERLPAASGGIWDRTEALQRFDQAMRTGDPGAIAARLIPAWRAMAQAGLEPVFAGLYGAQLLGFPLRGEPEQVALRLALLSKDYELAADRAERLVPLRVAAGIARGAAPDVSAAPPRIRAVGMAFSKAPSLPEPPAGPGPGMGLGEMILRAMGQIVDGNDGQPQAWTDGLVTLRALGLEDAARRTAIELILLKDQR